MFRSFIYLDADKMYAYKRQLEGPNKPKQKEYYHKKKTEISAEISNVGISRSTESGINGFYENDISSDYDQFEAELRAHEEADYFDFILNDYEIKTIPPMSLIRIRSCFDVPEEFDAVSTISTYKSMLISMVKERNVPDQEATIPIIEKAKADIPVVIDFGECLITGKLNEKYLFEDYTSLEEYMEQDVYLLCKVIGMAKSENVVIFDPLKDFIGLPRNMRRHMSDQNSIGLDKISIDGPALKVEILAIYK